MKAATAVISKIKVCGDPQCEAVFHNIPKKHTRCTDCDGRLIEINQATYNSKFANNFFQYEFTTGDYYRPNTTK
jgi:hypothetical protein